MMNSESLIPTPVRLIIPIRIPAAAISVAIRTMLFPPASRACTIPQQRVRKSCQEVADTRKITNDAMMDQKVEVPAV